MEENYERLYFFRSQGLLCNRRKFKTKKILIDLIEKDRADTFYVGNQGNFDIAVLKMLQELQNIYKHIRYFVVLAYHPTERDFADFIQPENTLFPEELEKIHPKFAISKRNEWMISKADYAVVFVRFITGGAAKYKTLSEKKGLKVFNIFDLT